LGLPPTWGDSPIVRRVLRLNVAIKGIAGLAGHSP